jgi:hypothetical protein
MMNNHQSKRRGKKRKAKYRVIVKVACVATCRDNHCQECKFLKYKYVNSFDSFMLFISLTYHNWRYANFFSGTTGEYQFSETRKGRVLYRGIHLFPYYAHV